jgi:hypothetical protein
MTYRCDVSVSTPRSLKQLCVVPNTARSHATASAAFQTFCRSLAAAPLSVTLQLLRHFEVTVRFFVLAT